MLTRMHRYSIWKVLKMGTVTDLTRSAGMTLLRASRVESAARSFEACASLEVPLAGSAHVMRGLCFSKLVRI